MTSWFNLEVADLFKLAFLKDFLPLPNFSNSCPVNSSLVELFLAKPTFLALDIFLLSINKDLV